MRKLSMDELGRLDVNEFKNAEKLPVVVVLDHVRSMHNVGSVFRTADCFAIEKLILGGITAQPPHREIEKTALGATESVLWEHQSDVRAALQNLREQGYIICAVEQVEGSVSLQDFMPNKDDKYVLVFGNEVNGVSDEVMELVDTCLEIPQFGTKHSFNISVTAGILLWDFYNKLI